MLSWEEGTLSTGQTGCAGFHSPPLALALFMHSQFCQAVSRTPKKEAQEFWQLKTAVQKSEQEPIYTPEGK